MNGEHSKVEPLPTDKWGNRCVRGGRKAYPYLVPTNGKLPAHVVNPETGRSYCQVENNATWPLWRCKNLDGRTPCKNCTGLQARAKSND